MTADMVATFEIPLPCGCVVKHSFRGEGAASNGDVAEKFCLHAGKVAGFWAKHRIDVRTHDCALVSETNPNGFHPAADKTEPQA